MGRSAHLSASPASPIAEPAYWSGQEGCGWDRSLVRETSLKDLKAPGNMAPGQHFARFFTIPIYAIATVRAQAATCERSQSKFDRDSGSGRICGLSGVIWPIGRVTGIGRQ
jgi:hypothetical protein